MGNPSLENGLKNKNLKTINCDKDKYNNILLDKKKKEKGFVRNKSCKGNIRIKNNIIINEENIVGERILKRKKKMAKSSVRRNISTDFINKKNSVNNNHQNLYRNNSHIENNRNSIKENNSNNNRLKRITNKMEEVIPPFELEKLLHHRLPSDNIDNKKSKNNVNVKININNNYNYINNLNIENNLNKFITENPIINYENINSHNKLVKQKSTSSIISENRQKKRNNCINVKKGGKYKELNINDISDNYFTNKNDSEKKYNNYYNVYFQKYVDEKMKSNKNKMTNSSQDPYIKSTNNVNNNDGRKIVYEKINIIKNGKEGRKYIKGPLIIKNIRSENNNHCKKQLFKYKNMLKKNNNDYSIQNFIKKELKDDKIGPRVILPKKMSLVKH